ncbi:MAG: hypothetical protein HYR63_27100, partial [Proteobacteria bacterium]|nr:hypothetical protein [Pseudomonadota bacterium]
IPLVGNVKELENQAALVRRAASAVMKETGARFHYLVGTMIEIPRLRRGRESKISGVERHHSGSHPQIGAVQNALVVRAAASSPAMASKRRSPFSGVAVAASPMTPLGERVEM